MVDIHPFAASRAHADRPPRATIEIDPASEAIRRGVQYLAFRLDAGDLIASYEPGPGQVKPVIAQAALAALEAHQELGREIDAATPPIRTAALATRLTFARQLAEVKASVPCGGRRGVARSLGPEGATPPQGPALRWPSPFADGAITPDRPEPA